MSATSARSAIVLLAATFLVVTAAGAQSKDPLLGAWKLNLAKSKYSPGPLPKSSTSTYEAVSKGYKVTVRTEPASGPVQEWSYTTSLDGTDAAIIGDNPNADTTMVKRVSATTLEVVNKKAGKVTTTQTNVIAADGKTRTVTTTGTDAQGRKINNVAIYDRQ